MNSPSLCPACDSPQLHVFYEQSAVPSHSCMLLDDPDTARDWPTGDLRLAVCHSCGFITNLDFDTGLQRYSETYEETQDFSPHFSRWLVGLVEDLIRRHDLHHKRVLEIGCGKGLFLSLLCRLGENQGVGIDPAAVAERLAPDVADRIQVITEYLKPEHSVLYGDFVACRHSLEHVYRPAELLGLIESGVRDRPETIIFFDLPDVMRVLKEGAFWDVYYEHCSYFTAGSLARLFRRTGFGVERLGLDYADQYLMLEARHARHASDPTHEIEESPEEIIAAVDHFVRTVATERARWTHEVRARTERGQSVALWGSGSKGVAFLTTLGLAEEIAGVVDINPYKQGKYMAGTGHQIVAPERLRVIEPDVVVAMNPVYRAEIQADLDAMGLNCELMTL